MLSKPFAPFSQTSGLLGRTPPAFVSPCVTRTTDYTSEDNGRECGFCFRDESCNLEPGLVCHCGVCRKASDPDVVCQKQGYVWDYDSGACTQERGPNPCDMEALSASAPSSGGLAEQPPVRDDAAKGLEAADIIVGMTTLGGNIGGGVYAYRAKGGFWWTLLGILVGGMAGNLTGRLVTLPLR